MPYFQVIPCNGTTTTSELYYQACYNSQMEDDFDVGCEKPLCWETYLGKQFYFLTLFDFAVQLGLVLFVDFPRVRLLGGCTAKPFLR